MGLNFEKEIIETSEQVYEGFCQENIEDEVILPDYCPEIFKICKTNARVYVTESRVQGKQCIISGKINFTVLYTSSIANRIQSYIHQTEFSHTFEIEEECENPQIRVKVVPEYVNSKASGRKKISFKAIVSIALKICCKKQNESIKCCSEKRFCENKKEISLTDTIAFCEKNVTVSDEIYIDKHFPGISEIVMTHGTLKINEKKILQNKVVLKGNIELNILYNSTDNDDMTVYKCDMPYGQIIDIEGANDELQSLVEGEVNDISFDIYDDEAGESRILKADINLNIKCEIMQNRNIQVLSDIFSYDKEIECKYKKLQNEYIFKKINNVQSVKSEITFDNKIEKISYIYGESKIEKVKTENDNMIISASLEVTVIYVTVDNSIEVQTKNIPFEYIFEGENAENLSRLRSMTKILNTSFSILSDNKINCSIDVEIEGYVYCSNKYKVLSEAEVSSEKIKVEKHSMVLYFASKNESVWDIAKRFKADKENIMTYNKLSEDKILADNMIIIPVN